MALTMFYALSLEAQERNRTAAFRRERVPPQTRCRRSVRLHGPAGLGPVSVAMAVEGGMRGTRGGHHPHRHESDPPSSCPAQHRRIRRHPCPPLRIPITDTTPYLLLGIPYRSTLALGLRSLKLSPRSSGFFDRLSKPALTLPSFLESAFFRALNTRRASASVGLGLVSR